MHPGATPIKTDTGRLEVARRSGTLTPVQRRLLILADGKKTVNDLGAFVRVGELDQALGHLLAHGLIVLAGQVARLEPPAAPGFTCSGPAELERPATSPREFERVRGEASRFVLEKLGAAGEPLCAAIDRCDNPQDLRKVLRGIELFVSQRLDRESAYAFARHFGALLL